MIERAAGAGVPFSWVAAKTYGQNSALRDWLEAPRQLRAGGAEKLPRADRGGSMRADQLAALVSAARWQQISCGDGAKGPGSMTGR